LKNITWIIVLYFLCTSENIYSAEIDEIPFSLNTYCNLLINFEFEKAKSLAEKHTDKNLSNELQELATLLFYAGQETKPIYYTTDSSSNSKEFSVIHNLKMGYNNLYHKPYDANSLTYFFEAYITAKELNNSNLIKTALLGILEFYHFEFYLTNKNFLSYLNEFKSLATTPTEKSWAYIYVIYFTSQSLFKEERSASETMLLLEKEINQLSEKHKLRPLFLSLKAFQLEYNNKLEESISFHKQAFDLCEEKPFLKYIKFRTSIRLADVFYKTNQFEKGLRYAEDAQNYMDLSDTLRSEAYIQKYKSINNNGLMNYKDAFNELTRYDEIRNILDFKENNFKNSSLEIQLQTAEKEKQILIEQQKKVNNRNIAFGLGAGILALGFITILYLKNSKRKQLIIRQELDIEIQKMEKQLKNQELSAIDAMLSGQEKERHRLASELHDSVGSTLAAAKLQFGYINKNKSNTDPLEEFFDKTEILLEQAYNEVRTMAHIKNSGVIANEGLLPAILNLAKNASVASGLQIEVNDFGLVTRIENTLEITIFRIIQELVTNIIKHANATNASISIIHLDNTLNIIIEDNGKGFDLNKSKNLGIGLSTMEKRIEHLDGSIEIDSSTKRGTTIIIDIPI
jgi:signal transduction histidine kinase